MTRKLYIRILLGMFAFAAILVIASMQSCVTQKQRERILKDCPIKIETKTTTETVVTPFDTTLFLKGYKGKEITAPNCDSLLKMIAANGGTLQTEENGVISTITHSNGVITFKCETDSLKAVITLLKKQIKERSESLVTVPAKCEKEHVTKWDSFRITGFNIVASIIGLLAIGWLLKKKFIG